jgi:hypothetical protein
MSRTLKNEKSQEFYTGLQACYEAKSQGGNVLALHNLVFNN